MASVTRQGQGSSVTFPLRPVSSWNKGMESKQFLTRVHMGGRTNRLNSLKFHPRLRLGAKGKSLQISSFKGTSQNDESGGRASGSSKSLKKSAKISYVPEDSEGTLIESPEITSEADEKMEGSRAIQKLFRNWLTLLRSPLPNQVVDETLDRPSTPEISDTQNLTQINKRGEIARAALCYFLALDSTIKIPLMIFLPLYVGVNVIYGAEVSKELTPLWILGPLFVALQIQTVRWLLALYVLSFKQTMIVAKKLQMAYNYIACGKLKADLWQPVGKLDYKAMLKYLGGWLAERNLDLMDIWPFYRKVYRELSYNRSNSA